MRVNQQELGEQIRTLPQSRVVILGVGNRLKGDDGVGPVICDLIRGRVQPSVVDAGTAPENYLGPISRLEPDVILVLDAADLRADPGTLAMMEREALACTGFSTHTASMGFLLGALDRGQQIRVLLLGIQPAGVCLGEGLSPPVLTCATQTADTLTDVFGC